MCKSIYTDINFSRKAIVDTVVLRPIPGATMDKVRAAIRKAVGRDNYMNTLSRLYWQPTVQDQNTLIAFAGEFKKRPGNSNRNQLLLDFGTAQSQRRAFGLSDIIIWGAVCSQGQFEVYSSQWSQDHSVRLMLFLTSIN
jgi:hypothetical protein